MGRPAGAGAGERSAQQVGRRELNGCRVFADRLTLSDRLQHHRRGLHVRVRQQRLGLVQVSVQSRVREVGAVDIVGSNDSCAAQAVE